MTSPKRLRIELPLDSCRPSSMAALAECRVLTADCSNKASALVAYCPSLSADF